LARAWVGSAGAGLSAERTGRPPRATTLLGVVGMSLILLGEHLR
jgi:hypothetical protein